MSVPFELAECMCYDYTGKYCVGEMTVDQAKTYIQQVARQFGVRGEFNGNSRNGYYEAVFTGSKDKLRNMYNRWYVVSADGKENPGESFDDYLNDINY